MKPRKYSDILIQLDFYFIFILNMLEKSEQLPSQTIPVVKVKIRCSSKSFHHDELCNGEMNI